MLGEIAVPAATQSLVPALDDADPDVLASIARALGRYGPTSAAPALKARLDRLPANAPLYVREAVAKSLAECHGGDIDPTLTARRQQLSSERRALELAGDPAGPDIPEDLRDYLPPPDPPPTEAYEAPTSSTSPLRGRARQLPPHVVALLEHVRRYITDEAIVDEPFSGLRDQYRTGILTTPALWKVVERYRLLHFAWKRGVFIP